MGESFAGPTRPGVRARRETVRDETFARRRPGRERYETPAWLERSFVLPVQPTPDQSAEATRTDHGDLSSGSSPEASVPTAPASRHVPAREWPEFVRPASAEIDFATVVRRADALRLARRTALFALALTAFVLGIMVLTGSTTVLPLMMVSAGGVFVSAVVLVVLRYAPLPHVRG